MNTFFKAQFNNCPAIWNVSQLFHSHNKINRLHGCCLRIVYNDKLSNFEELLHRDNSVSSIHHNNIQVPAIKIDKGVNDMS